MKELPILQIDPLLRPYQGDLALRMENYRTRLAALLPDGQDLAAFADGAAYFGFHRQADGWWYREWAPGADAMYLTGDFNGWDRRACPMTRRAGGVFDVFLPGRDALRLQPKGGEDLFPQPADAFCRTIQQGQVKIRLGDQQRDAGKSGPAADVDDLFAAKVRQL